MCVLDKTPAKDCKVPKCPVVNAPTMTAAAQNEQCNACSLDDTTTKYSPCGETVGMKMEYLDRLPVKCDADQALLSFRLGKYNCGKDRQQYKFTCGAAKFDKVNTRSTACAVLREKDAQYLDRQNVKCASDEVLTGFKVVRGGCDGKDMRYSYTCGKLPKGDTSKVDTQTKCTLIKDKGLHFLDRQNVKCPAGKALSAFRLLNKRGCKGGDFSYHIACKGC